MTYEIVYRGGKEKDFASWEAAAIRARILILNQQRFDVSIREEK